MDFFILDFIQENLRSPAMDQIMIFFTKLCDSGVLWLVIGCFFTCFKKTRAWGILLIITVAFTALMGDGCIKSLVGRVRPFYQKPMVDIIINPPIGSSFPSGHAASSFAAAFIINKMNRKIGIAAFIIAVIIGFSRMYLYVHFTTDVLAGALLGILCGLLAYLLAKKIFKGKFNIIRFIIRKDHLKD
jgi:undecaprenyl-diphosphatase